MKRFLQIIVFALLLTTSGNATKLSYIDQDTMLCKTRGCSMSLEEFAERMSLSSGTDFKFSNGRDLLCVDERGLLGYYRPSTHAITMCNENAESAQVLARTIAHETVHAGQSCLNSHVPFDKGMLNAREKEMVQNLYPYSEWKAEYNARAISNYLVQNIGESDRLASVIEEACYRVSTKGLQRNALIRALHH